MHVQCFCDCVHVCLCHWLWYNSKGHLLTLRLLHGVACSLLRETFRCKMWRMKSAKWCIFGEVLQHVLCVWQHVYMCGFRGRERWMVEEGKEVAGGVGGGWGRMREGWGAWRGKPIIVRITGRLWIFYQTLFCCSFIHFLSIFVYFCLCPCTKFKFQFTAALLTLLENPSIDPICCIVQLRLSVINYRRWALKCVRQHRLTFFQYALCLCVCESLWLADSHII